MMFIPEKIKVGYQDGRDTYTGRLAYVIYYDERGKLRKEASWNSWRSSSIEPDDFENIPTEGFVLNKKAGGYKSDWNYRQSYIRVYDPRGFEFEITPENLLFILENTSSIKGKGLEGKFVYGWKGKDLMLIPTECPSYEKWNHVNKKSFQGKRYVGKDMILGATYLTKNGSHYTYMGRYDYFTYDYVYQIQKYVTKNKGKYYFFYDKNNILRFVKTLSREIVDTISEEPVSHFAELMDMLECDKHYSPVDADRYEFVQIDAGEFAEDSYEFYYRHYLLRKNKKLHPTRIQSKRNSYGTKGLLFYLTDPHQSKIFTETYDSLQELIENHEIGKVRYYLKNGKLQKQQETYKYE